MADAIESIPVMSRHLSQWGVKFNEYDYTNPVKDGKPAVWEGLDLERLSIKISNRRAVVIESEVQPMAVRMARRNTELDQLGKALSDLSAFSAQYTTKSDGTLETKARSTFTEDGAKGLALAGLNVTISRGRVTIEGKNFDGSGPDGSGPYEGELDKASCDKWTQLVKTATDTRNNDSSMDMTRIESLVNRRDEAYNTSSSLSDKISGTRSNTIKNFV